jgi:ABC-type dipeptide/oligopeptide/nickel transport system ATPase subunit
VKALSAVRLSEYLDESDSQNVMALLEKLVSVIQESEARVRIEYEAVRLTNYTLEKFRAYTAAKTGSATRPSGTGFKQFANNRLVLRDAMSNIAGNLTFKEKKEYELLGTTGGKGKIEIEKRYRMLNDLPKTKSSHKEYGGNKIKLDDVKKSLTKVNSLALSCLLDDPLADLKSRLEEADISSIGDFIGIYKQTVDKDRNPYSPSNGERSIIFIQKALNNPDAKIFLLDEPELSMANSYIDEVIRPRISELGRQKKTVILATHNANLAVRTLPYTTIYRAHDSDGYKTYVGNPFTNKLINMDNEEDTRDWKETSMKILEGGREAFYDREGIYESGR